MTDTITADMVITALRKAVADKGADHVQKECIYFDNGSPVCIWGYAWHSITGETVAPCAAPLYGDAIFSGVPRYVNEYAAEMFNLDRRAASIVAAAQFVADHHTGKPGTWGDALAAAERQYASGKVLPSSD